VGLAAQGTACDRGQTRMQRSNSILYLRTLLWTFCFRLYAMSRISDEDNLLSSATSHHEQRKRKSNSKIQNLTLRSIMYHLQNRNSNNNTKKKSLWSFSSRKDPTPTQHSRRKPTQGHGICTDFARRVHLIVHSRSWTPNSSIPGVLCKGRIHTH
jgi:hypothetical protein